MLPALALCQSLLGAWIKQQLARWAWRVAGASFRAVCAPPVARLEKVWKRVEPGAVGLVEGWIRDARPGEARVTPWGGDVAAVVQEEMLKVGAVEDDGVLKAAPMEKVRGLFERFRTSFELCPRKTIEEGEVDEGMKKLVAYWGDMLREGGGSGGVAMKFKRCVSVKIAS